MIKHTTTIPPALCQRLREFHIIYVCITPMLIAICSHVQVQTAGHHSERSCSFASNAIVSACKNTKKAVCILVFFISTDGLMVGAFTCKLHYI